MNNNGDTKDMIANIIKMAENGRNFKDGLVELIRVRGMQVKTNPLEGNTVQEHYDGIEVKIDGQKYTLDYDIKYSLKPI